jgi:hypothetical protein
MVREHLVEEDSVTAVSEQIFLGRLKVPLIALTRGIRMIEYQVRSVVFRARKQISSDFAHAIPSNDLFRSE